MLEIRVREAVLQASVPGARWLSTGWNGGYRDGDAAYNISVPIGWDRTDLTAYVRERVEAAGFTADGPALLTGVDMRHAVGARLGAVWAVATVGLSNPASLPLEPDEQERTLTDPDGTHQAAASTDPSSADTVGTDRHSDDIGTVNLIVGTDRELDDGGLATLLGVVVEAKTATLQQLTGFSGTTSDAAVVATDPEGEPSDFAGSATEVGAAARAAVRESVVGATNARYDGDDSIPASVADADSGIETTRRADRFEI